jgi:hypothetical protein
MLPCSSWPTWSVPSSAKYRIAVNWASTRFNQDELVGVRAISTLLAAAHCPTRLSFLVVRWGLKLSQTIAILIVGG